MKIRLHLVDIMYRVISWRGHEKSLGVPTLSIYSILQNNLHKNFKHKLRTIKGRKVHYENNHLSSSLEIQIVWITEQINRLALKLATFGDTT